ncbi:MAG: T9SS type A sorting domain-containing protein [Bacteroidetes bacterium]|nr:T9SS type A sorting domain-containing protein [Bacteroidota bacterium]
MKNIVVLMVCTFTAFTCMAQWVLQHIGYEQPNIGTSYIEVLNENDLWSTSFDAMGANQTQYYSRSNDGGNTWNPGFILGYTSYQIDMISAINYSTAWVLLLNQSSNDELALKTTNGGLNWLPQYPCVMGSNHPVDIHFWNENEGVCFGKALGSFEIYTTTDGGQNWTVVDNTNLPTPLSNERIAADSHSVFDNIIWVTTWTGIKCRVLKSIDKGLTWSVSSLPFSPTSGNSFVRFLNSNHGFARSMSQEYAETQNGGFSWTLLNPIGSILHGGMFYWVPGSFNTLTVALDGCSYSFDGGHTWSAFDTLQNKQCYSTAWLDNSHGWVGATTELPTPAYTGIWKFTGTLNAILEMDPGQGGVTFYPNPCKGLVNMVLVGFLGEDVVLDIFNLQGQKVYTAEFHQTLIQSDRKIDLSFLKSGTYVVSVRSGKKCLVKKIVVE